MATDAIGNRMKSNYEDRTRIKLPRRGYTLIRIDGKAFHTYTKGLERPFDTAFMSDMDATAAYLCKNIMGAKFAFVQSDEISILLTDFDTLATEAWFDNNLQKMCSVSASMATRAFNELRVKRYINECIAMEHNMQDVKYGVNKLAEFDSRVWQIPSKSEVANYFIWRQQDTVRNSISSVAQSLYSHKELEGKNVSVQQEMSFQKGINWNDYRPAFKRGRIIAKHMIEGEDLESLRTDWVMVEPPTFTQDPTFLHSLIPENL